MVTLIWPALIGAGASIIGGVLGNKSANKSRNAQMAMHNDQMELSRDQMGFAEDHYNYGRGRFEEYEARFDPVLDAMQDEAMANRAPDYGLISADAAQAFGSQREAGQRQMQRYGINPGDGMWGANNRQAQLGQAGAEVMAMQNARRNAGNQRYSQLANLYGVGAGMMSGAGSMMGQGLAGSSAAAGQAIGAMGQAANAHGNQAAAAGQQASNNWAAAGRYGGQIFDHFSGGNSPQTPDYGPAPAGTSGTAPWRP